MKYPSLVKYKTINDYQKHFENIYCRTTIVTFDNIAVRFKKSDFAHCFFESVRTKDDTFSQKRAERIDWIKKALEDPNSDRFQGWDKKRKRYDKSRRVAIVMGNYVVVIRLTNKYTANFITAFFAETKARRGIFSTIDKIRLGHKWI